MTEEGVVHFTTSRPSSSSPADDDSVDSSSESGMEDLLLDYSSSSWSTQFVHDLEETSDEEALYQRVTGEALNDNLSTYLDTDDYDGFCGSESIHGDSELFDTSSDISSSSPILFNTTKTKTKPNANTKPILPRLSIPHKGTQTTETSPKSNVSLYYTPICHPTIHIFTPGGKMMPTLQLITPSGAIISPTIDSPRITKAHRRRRTKRKSHTPIRVPSKEESELMEVEIPVEQIPSILSNPCLTYEQRQVMMVNIQRMVLTETYESIIPEENLILRLTWE